MGTEENRRARFENWAMREGLYLEKNANGAYCYIYTRYAWGGWCAALDSVCVELPLKFDPILDGVRHAGYAEEEARDRAIDDCRAAIEAAGLRVKQ